MATQTDAKQGGAEKGDATGVSSSASTPQPLPVAVTLEGLQKQYGKAEGERLYHEIAVKGGFGNFRAVSHNYSPDLDLSGLKGGERKAVEEAWADANSPAGRLSAAGAEQA